jgi:hypothetical protein
MMKRLAVIAGTTFSIGVAWAETKVLEATVHGVQATLVERRTGSPRVEIEFKLRLTNHGGDTIPFDGGAWSASTIEARASDGKWIVLMQGIEAVVGFGGANRFPNCGALAPGQSAEVVGNRSFFFFRDERRIELGSELTMRMQVRRLCVGPEGALKDVRAWTEPFGLTVPQSERPRGRR